jgi:hypothetical protein
MLNFYQLMTPQGGLFMDVFEGVPNSPPKKVVDGYTRNSPPSDNQFWWFMPGPDNNPGYFYIRSKLSPDLFLDVKGGNQLPNTALQIYTQNSPPKCQSALEVRARTCVDVNPPRLYPKPACAKLRHHGPGDKGFAACNVSPKFTRQR